MNSDQQACHLKKKKTCPVFRIQIEMNKQGRCWDKDFLVTPVNIQI